MIINIIAKFTLCPHLVFIFFRQNVIIYNQIIISNFKFHKFLCHNFMEITILQNSVRHQTISLKRRANQVLFFYSVSLSLGKKFSKFLKPLAFPSLIRIKSTLIIGNQNQPSYIFYYLLSATRKTLRKCAIYNHKIVRTSKTVQNQPSQGVPRQPALVRKILYSGAKELSVEYPHTCTMKVQDESLPPSEPQPQSDSLTRCEMMLTKRRTMFLFWFMGALAVLVSAGNAYMLTWMAMVVVAAYVANWGVTLAANKLPKNHVPDLPYRAVLITGTN